MTVENQEKSNATLFFKLPHKFYLVRMNILQGKSIHGTFLGIKAYRDSLHGTDVVYGTLLFEKSQCDLPAVLMGVIGVGIFCINASPASAYFSLVRLTMSSSVDPRSPLVFHVAIC